MKLRFFLFLSLILHIFVFFTMSKALWLFLFPLPVQDLTTVEILETVAPSSSVNSVTKKASQRIVAPVKASSESKPNENASSNSIQSAEAGKAIEQKSFEAVSVGAVTVAPKVLKEKRIAYPERARRAGVEGIVELKLVVDPEGKVREAEIVKGLGYGLGEAALSAIQGFEFSPAKMGADPVAVRIIYKYRFQLNR